MLIRWLMPTAFARNGKIVKRVKGDEDFVSKREARGFVQSGQAEIVTENHREVSRVIDD